MDLSFVDAGGIRTIKLKGRMDLQGAAKIVSHSRIDEVLRVYSDVSEARLAAKTPQVR
jgi:hypothetical protein